MSRTRFTPPVRLKELPENGVFVFGSNLAGHHGGGAAADAVKYFGAVFGKGEGIQGKSYAIPTMQGSVETIRPYVDSFINYAKENPNLLFYVTPIGCGIAGHSIHEIAPLFKQALDMDNVLLPRSFYLSLIALEWEEDGKDPIVQELYLERKKLDKSVLEETKYRRFIATDTTFTHIIAKTKEGKYGLFETDIIGMGADSDQIISIGKPFAWDEAYYIELSNSFDFEHTLPLFYAIIALRRGQNWYIISLSNSQELCFISKGKSWEEANRKISGIIGIQDLCFEPLL